MVAASLAYSTCTRTRTGSHPVKRQSSIFHDDIRTRTRTRSTRSRTRTRPSLWRYVLKSLSTCNNESWMSKSRVGWQQTTVVRCTAC